MRKTYAHNSIIIGVLIGLLVLASTKSLLLGILALLGVSAVGFLVIRLIENAVSAGVDKVADKVADARAERKNQQAQAAQQNVTRMPVRAGESERGC